MIESEAIDVRAGDVHITPEQIGDVNIGTYGPDDYVLDTGNKMKAELVTNNAVRIFDGVMVYGGIRDAVPVNKYYDITIDNGSQGKNRNDIIVRRYTKDDDAEKKARAVFTVVKGTPTDGTAADPDISFTDIRAGALTHDMKLHRVRLEGLNIVAVEPLFDVLMPMSEQQAMLAELNGNKPNFTHRELLFSGGIGKGETGQISPNWTKYTLFVARMGSTSDSGVTTAIGIRCKDDVSDGWRDIIRFVGGFDSGSYTDIYASCVEISETTLTVLGASSHRLQTSGGNPGTERHINELYGII